MSDRDYFSSLKNRIIDIEKSHLYENERPGRIPHIEDLVLEEGPEGLIKSFQILRSFGDGSHPKTNIKWDGSVCVVFGRDENGNFILTDKSGWNAKTYNGKVTSADDLERMFSSRKPTMDDKRKKFIAAMKNIFHIYQNAVPINFRGFFIGDLMYFDTPQLAEDMYVLKPNVVEYRIDPKSEVGKRIGKTRSGIVLHEYIGNQYKSVEEAIGAIGNEVLAIPPISLKKSFNVDTVTLDKLEAFANKHASCIKAMFNPNSLKGIADVHQLMYKYINSKVDTGLSNLGKDFKDWLYTERLSDKKRHNVLRFVVDHKTGVDALWKIISGIIKIKEDLIKEFDKTSQINQSVNGQEGGEGYVVYDSRGLVKLVSRKHFSAANRSANR